MIPLNLTASEQAAFHRALVTDHDIDIRVSLLDLEEKHLGDLSGLVMGGQVVASDGEVSRTCQVSILDPENSTGVDNDRPGQAAGLSRMISVTYGVWVDDIGAEGEWVRVPIFRGPITKVSRDGDTLEIEAMGKEHLLRSPAGFTKVYAAGLTRTGVIKDIALRCGERFMHIPQQKARTGKNSIMVKLDRDSVPWSSMAAAAKSMRMSLYYDGAGMLRLRRQPTRTSWWFKEDHLLSEPKISLGDEDVINTVHVKGSPPEGKKKLIESRGSLPKWHGHSPWSLGRNGVPRYLVEVIEDDEIRTQADADYARDVRLRELFVESYEVSFDCLVIPHLDRMDVCHLGWSDFPMAFRVRSFTIPLKADESMSIGYVKDTRRRGGPKWRARPKAKKAVTKKAPAKSTGKKTTVTTRSSSGGSSSGRL